MGDCLMHPDSPRRLAPDYRCKACEAIRVKVWRDANKSHVSRQRQEHYRAESEAIRARQKKYYQNNKANYVANAAAYQDGLFLRTPSWADLRNMDLIYQLAAKLGYQVDHWYPLRGDVVCGLHVRENLHLMSQVNNSSKGNKMPEDWLKEQSNVNRS